jgi:hypothetical protein
MGFRGREAISTVAVGPSCRDEAGAKPYKDAEMDCIRIESGGGRAATKRLFFVDHAARHVVDNDWPYRFRHTPAAVHFVAPNPLSARHAPLATSTAHVEHAWFSDIQPVCSIAYMSCEQPFEPSMRSE